MINASIHTESTIYRTPQSFTENRDELGRSIGYAYANNGSVQQTVSTGYGTDGRIASAGFVYGGAQKTFSYAYLPGTHLLQTLTKPAPFSASYASPCGRDRRDCPRYGLFFPDFEKNSSFYLYIQ